eukprot:TRINITY_DN885_c0_g3_i3.p2 TRINITY_DN885_c0_g3~~TRINITY_DN885_c0_g3_i3.p2  ORF type:complete len:147 (+),score=3.48 TRINITY_DN885_c0_g3_i3:961-1401(+)
MNGIEHHWTADSEKLDPSRLFLLPYIPDLHHWTQRHRIEPSILLLEKMLANATIWRLPSLGPFARDHLPSTLGSPLHLSHSLDVTCNHHVSVVVMPCGPIPIHTSQVLLLVWTCGIPILWHKHCGPSHMGSTAFRWAIHSMLPGLA